MRQVVFHGRALEILTGGGQRNETQTLFSLVGEGIGRKQARAGAQIGLRQALGMTQWERERLVTMTPALIVVVHQLLVAAARPGLAHRLFDCATGQHVGLQLKAR